MHKIQVRPQLGRKLAPQRFVPCKISSQAGGRYATDSANSFVFRKIRSFFFFTILVGGLSLVFSGCGGLVMNSGASGALIASPVSVQFGTVAVGQKATTKVSLLNHSVLPIKISQMKVAGDSFSVDGGSTLPVSIAAGGTFSMNMDFVPVTKGALSGTVTIKS